MKGTAHTQARRAALRGGRSRAEAERAEFVTLFKDLVTYAYILQLEPYASETIVFTGESEDDGSITVSTMVQARRGPVPVDYRMHQVADGRWLVYDVLVEGVSLVGNYRSQFNTIIQTASYAELIRRIKVRVAELTAASSA